MLVFVCSCDLELGKSFFSQKSQKRSLTAGSNQQTCCFITTEPDVTAASANGTACKENVAWSFKSIAMETV